MEFCENCGRPEALAETESVHRTSEGLVRYRRCECGRRWVQLATLVAEPDLRIGSFGGPQDNEYLYAHARRRAARRRGSDPSDK
jgi:hypothetical protein